MSRRNVHGLGSAPAPRNSNDDGNELFTQAGSGSSSTAVLRPKHSEDSVNDVVTAAKEQGRSGQFNSGDFKTVLKIILFQNGFKVGEDGEFRDKSNPQSQKFLNELKQGVVPSELEAEIERTHGDLQQVRVDLVDRSREEFTPPKPSFQAFQGAGFSMGSASGSAPVDVSFSGATAREVELSPGEPTTTLQIVTHDRKRLRATFMLSNTVLDIYRHVMAISGHPGPFRLLSGFPPKPLNDPSATIQDSGLKGASIQQKL
eukprot:116321_1